MVGLLPAGRASVDLYGLSCFPERPERREQGSVAAADGAGVTSLVFASSWWRRCDPLRCDTILGTGWCRNGEGSRRSVRKKPDQAACHEPELRRMRLLHCLLPQLAVPLLLKHPLS